MSNPILIASPNPNFGSLIQKNLETASDYKIFRVISGNEALKLGKSHVFSLAILDTGLRDLPLPALVSALRSRSPELKVVLIIPGKDPRRLEGSPADAFLPMPFQSSDLLDLLDLIRPHRQTLDAIFETPVIPPRESPKKDEATKKDPGYAWLEDSSRAVPYLTRLTLESGAQATLIIRAGSLWAYAGELLEVGANELAQTVAHDWESNGESDMARFVRLASNGVEYMVYATYLADRMVLAVVYNAETPFSKIRSEAGKLARALAAPPQGEGGVDLAEQAEWTLEYNEVVRTEQAEIDETLERALANLPPLFEDVPPPTVDSAASSGYNSAAGNPPQVSLGEEGPLFSEPEIPPIHAEAHASEASQPTPAPFLAGAANVEHKVPSSADTVGHERLTPVEPEPAVVAASQLYYSCVLIPRLPRHRLVGDIVEYLQQRMTQVCLSFDWRLEHMVIRADAFIWVVKITPKTSALKHIRTVRRLTSEHIFEQIPRLARENPSKDFWAPGFLVTGEAQPATAQTVQAFIHQTRQRQGALEIQA